MKKIITLLMIAFAANLSAANPRWEKAQEAYQAEEWKKAIELFGEIKKEEKEYTKAQRYIGYNIYGRKLNNWEKAIEHCINAYQKDPKDKKVLQDLGRACLNREKELK